MEEKIRNREGMTEKAAFKQEFISDKEALIRSCENQEFPLAKGNIDLAKKRAMQRHQNTQQQSDRLVSSIKSDKDRYFEKCVE